MTETLCVPAMLGNKAIEVKVQSTVKSIVRHYPFLRVETIEFILRISYSISKRTFYSMPVQGSQKSQSREIKMARPTVQRGASC